MPTWRGTAQDLGWPSPPRLLLRHTSEVSPHDSCGALDRPAAGGMPETTSVFKQTSGFPGTGLSKRHCLSQPCQAPGNAVVTSQAGSPRTVLRPLTPAAPTVCCRWRWPCCCHRPPRAAQGMAPEQAMSTLGCEHAQWSLGCAGWGPARHPFWELPPPLTWEGSLTSLPDERACDQGLTSPEWSQPTVF